MLSDERLLELIDLARKATPAPYIHEAGILKHYVYSENHDLGFGLQELHPYDGREWPTKETAAYIVAACNTSPALALELLAARNALREIANLPFDSDVKIDMPYILLSKIVDIATAALGIKDEDHRI